MGKRRFHARCRYRNKHEKRQGSRDSDESGRVGYFALPVQWFSSAGICFYELQHRHRLKEIKRSFNTALRLGSIEGLVWHDLRATFGTRLGEAGYDAFTIAALMGHSDIHPTTRYVRATERNKREAVEAVMLGSQKLSTNWPHAKSGQSRWPL